MNNQVQLLAVEKHEKPHFRNLLQDYLGEDGGRIFSAPKNQDGSYSYPYFDLYWQEPSRIPFYILNENIIAGFVLLRKLDDNLYSIAEFYILPINRKSGIGRSAMNKVFETFPNKSWLISVIRENNSAFEFWQNVAEHSTVPIELEIIEKRRYNWPEIS